MAALFRAIPAADPAHYVRGQYDGYREIEGVASDSATETYAALRLVFKRPPRLGFQLAGAHEPQPDQLIVKLDPSTGVRLLLEAQRSEAREPEQISLDMEFAAEGGEGPAPYEVLLHAAMQGDSARFKRQDGVEEAWRVMGPLLTTPPAVHPYAKGSWGPAEADRLLTGYGRWHEPWMP